MAKERDWQAVNVRKDLLKKLAALPDSPYVSQNGLVNRAIDEWLTARNDITTPSQFESSISQWSVEERRNAFLVLARYLASDFLPASEDDSESLEFLKAIVSGRRPSDSQIGELAHVSDFTEEELIALRDRLFPNGEKHQNGDPLNRF